MLAQILIVVAVLIAVLIVIIALRPSDFRVTRSATVAAPPADVFAQVNDLRKWEAWSPWAKIDPAMKQTYEGPPAGVGAVSTWSGNCKVGEGRNTIVESRPNEAILCKLEFFKPFKATNAAEFTFKPEGGQTLVTWSMSGKNNFMVKAFGMFMNCDKMIGSQFEQGLAQLNSAVAAATQKQPVS